MATLVVTHPVADYGSWRAVYDEVGSLRTQYGCTADRVIRGADDPLQVLVMHEFPTVEDARGFAHDPALKQAMDRAGVAGPPRIEIYEPA